MTKQNHRAGTFRAQPTGYSAFIPADLPPVPPVRFDAELIKLLSDADRAVGRLDMVTAILPNPDLFIGMYVRQEAVLSSQIEGTQSTLEDVLEFEAGATEEPKDVEEVINYVAAMNHGLRRLEELPMSLRLIREIHAELMRSGRGSNSTPGEFRKTQNWIGPAGCTLKTATHVPPPVSEMHDSLHNLENFLHATQMPVLIHAAIAHAQFETIHPFLDGNGRVGRLLITFLLCQREVLQKPVLYLSHFLKKHRSDYYDNLTAIRESGDWERWLKFFLRGIYEVSQEATQTTREIVDLRTSDIEKIQKLSGKCVILLDYLFEKPVVTSRHIQARLDIAYSTAARLIDKFVELDILKETSGAERNRRYTYAAYLNLFTARGASPDILDISDSQRTESQ